MITDQRRTQSSAALAAGLHVMLLSTYFLLVKSQQQAQVVLTQVEFLDLKAESAQAQAAAGPAEQAPRSMRDFLKMAIPIFHRSQPQEDQMKDVSVPNEASQTFSQSGPQIKIDASRQLQQESAASFHVSAAREGQSSLSDLAATSRAQENDEMAMPQKESEISLDAVGRQAVGSPSAFINLSSKKGPAGGGSLADLSEQPQAEGSAQTSGSAQASISLKEGPVGAGGGKAFPSSMPYGYNSGGGSISLQERPAATVGGALPLAQEAVKPNPKQMALELGKHSKGIEISGPLAKRKIVSYSVPPYPDWAKEQNVEADVLIRFFVSPSGSVLERMIVERTSGYPELDRLAEDALKKWTFVPLSEDEQSEGDQWGFITFRFKLK